MVVREAEAAESAGVMFFLRFDTVRVPSALLLSISPWDVVLRSVGVDFLTNGSRELAFEAMAKKRLRFDKRYKPWYWQVLGIEASI